MESYSGCIIAIPGFNFRGNMRSEMKQAICAIGGAALLVVVGATSPAHADDICSQYGTAVVAGKYIVQNNRWNGGVPGEQCIKVIDQGPGFAITKQTGSAPTNGGPVSYPSIYVGCHYGNCSPGTNLPMQVKSIKKAETSIDLKYVGGATFDASYDIWLDPTPKKTGVNKQEIMIWLNKQGQIQPVGNSVGNVTIANQNWQVWSGSNGQNDVISYVAPSAVSSMTFNVMDFVADVAKRVKNTGDFYLTSIQAGFEPWQGGQGLAIEDFRATVDAR
jgi:Glycosyl hydrolase family 12